MRALIVAACLVALQGVTLAADVRLAWDRVEYGREFDGVFRDEVYAYRACQFTLAEEPTGLCLRVEGRADVGPVLEAGFTNLPCIRTHWRVQAIAKCAAAWPGCMNPGEREGPWSVEDVSQLPTEAQGIFCVPSVPSAIPPAPTAHRDDLP